MFVAMNIVDVVEGVALVLARVYIGRRYMAQKNYQTGSHRSEEKEEDPEHYGRWKKTVSDLIEQKHKRVK